MRNRRKDNKPTDEPEDVTSWEIPTQVEVDGPTESSPFFAPPASSSLGEPPTADELSLIHI